MDTNNNKTQEIKQLLLVATDQDTYFGCGFSVTVDGEINHLFDGNWPITDWYDAPNVTKMDAHLHRRVVDLGPLWHQICIKIVELF